MNNPTQDISASPGLILKAARDELNLSVEQVAHELHLRASVVKALETEEYDEFSSDVFLKGYFRSYCRLVNLHEERMVEILEKQLNCRQIERENTAQLEKKALASIARKKAMVVMALFAFILAISGYLISYFYIDSHDSETISIESTAISKVDLKDEREQISQISQNAVVTQEVSVTQNQSNSQGQIKKETEQAFEASKKAVQQTQTVEEKLFVEKRKLSTFESTFTGDCWFKLVDAKNKTIFAALKHAGDSISYSGIAPYQIILGDASKVNIVFEGQDINLKPHTAKNGLAQFTLTSHIASRANQAVSG